MSMPPATDPTPASASVRGAAVSRLNRKDLRDLYLNAPIHELGQLLLGDFSLHPLTAEIRAESPQLSSLFCVERHAPH